MPSGSTIYKWRSVLSLHATPPYLVLVRSVSWRFTQQMWHAQQLRLATVFCLVWRESSVTKIVCRFFCRQANDEDVKKRPPFRYAGDSCLDNGASSESAHRRKYALSAIRPPHFRYLLLCVPSQALPIRATCPARCTILPVTWCPKLFTSSSYCQMFYKQCGFGNV